MIELHGFLAQLLIADVAVIILCGVFPKEL
jgi:hypothetical protein